MSALLLSHWVRDVAELNPRILVRLCSCNFCLRVSQMACLYRFVIDLERNTVDGEPVNWMDRTFYDLYCDIYGVNVCAWPRAYETIASSQANVVEFKLLFIVTIFSCRLRFVWRIHAASSNAPLRDWWSSYQLTFFVKVPTYSTNLFGLIRCAYNCSLRTATWHFRYVQSVYHRADVVRANDDNCWIRWCGKLDEEIKIFSILTMSIFYNVNILRD